MQHPPATTERPGAVPDALPPETRGGLPGAVLLIVCLAGLTAFVCTFLGSISVGVVAGLAVLVLGLALLVWIVRHPRVAGPADGSRRRFLQAGVGGVALVGVGTALGRAVDEALRPDAVAVQDAAASDLGAEYMELVGRAANAQRSGDIQLLLAPFNSANYSFESLSLHPRDPRTSHAAVWMYLERIPLVAYGPGVIEPGDSEERVSLADLAPTTAKLIGFDEWPTDREGGGLPGFRTTGKQPKVVVTYVFDGGGWNVLRQWPNDWPNLGRLMREGMHYRNALTGSFPAVTACAHATIGTGTFPRQHGITGHNIRDGAVARKAYRTPGHADPSDISVPTLSDLWHGATGAWVGQIGSQVWHMGMLGHGGTDRPVTDLPVGVYFDEPGGGGWQPHNPDLFRLPEGTPGMDVLDARMQAFDDPHWDPEWEAWRTTYCCVPPIAAYQGDLLESTLTNEPIGDGAPSLLYTTFKSPDYTGHVYGMQSKWEGLMLQAVDEELGRIVRFLDQRFPGEYALFVTADHDSTRSSSRPSSSASSARGWARRCSTPRRRRSTSIEARCATRARIPTTSPPRSARSRTAKTSGRTSRPARSRHSCSTTRSSRPCSRATTSSRTRPPAGRARRSTPETRSTRGSRAATSTARSLGAPPSPPVRRRPT
jgi:hypothetical protein